MSIRNWVAAAVLAAAVPASALAQQPTSPVAPRSGASAASADGKIAVLNTGAFYDKIFELKSKQDQVEKKYEPRVNELKNLQTQIETQTKSLESQRGVASADKLQTMAEQIGDMQKRYKRQAEDLQAEMQREGETAIKPVRDKLSNFVKGYAAQRNIVLILDKAGSYQNGTVAYIADAIDITDDFIAEYNKANPVPGAATPAPRAGR